MEAAIKNTGYPYVLATNPVPDHSWFNPMPDIVVFGAGYELLSLRLLSIASELRIPTLAIQEVSQLLLNNNGLNNYTFPFDKLLVANQEEYDRFVNFGKKRRELKIAGLQCFENIPQRQTLIKNRNLLRHKLTIADGQKALIVVCAPLKSTFNRHSQETRIIRKKYFALLTALPEEWKILLRYHPTELAEEGEAIRKMILPEALIISSKYSIYEVLAMSDAVLTRGNTQVTLESIAFGKPTAIIQPDINPFDASLIKEISIKADLLEFLRISEKVSAPELSKYERYIYQPLNHASKNIALEISKVSRTKLFSNSKTAYNIASSFIEFGRYHEALDIIRNADPEFANTMIMIDLLEVIFKEKSILPSFDISDDSYHVHFLFAEACFITHELDCGIPHLNRFLVLLPPFLESRFAPRYYRLLSKYKIELTGYRDAVKDFEILLEKQPSNESLIIEYIILISNCYGEKIGIEKLKQFIDRDPDCVDFRNALGRLLTQRNLLDQAEKEFKKSISLNDSYYCSHFDYAIFLLTAMRLDEAERSILRAIDLDPSIPDAHHEYGRLLFNKGNLKASEIEFRTAIQLNPYSPWPHFELGKILVETGEIESAESEFKEVIRIEPEYNWAHFDLGKLFMKSGRLRAAETEFQEAIRLGVNSEWCHYDLGRLYLITGRPKAAETEFQEAIRLGLNSGRCHHALGK